MRMRTRFFITGLFILLMAGLGFALALLLRPSHIDRSGYPKETMTTLADGMTVSVILESISYTPEKTLNFCYRTTFEMPLSGGVPLKREVLRIWQNLRVDAERQGIPKVYILPVHEQQTAIGPADMSRSFGFFRDKSGQWNTDQIDSYAP